MSKPTRMGQAAWLARLNTDLPASIVVFLVALPLCMGVAIASDVPISAGLISGIVGGIVAGALAGSPLQVSGPAAGLTVVIFQFVQTHGFEKLGVVVLLAGLIQFLAGIFKLGQWFRAVSPAVIQGMLAGIGALILVSQFHVMVDSKPRHNGIQNIVAIPQAIWENFRLPDFGTQAERTQQKQQLKFAVAQHSRQLDLLKQVKALAPATKDQAGTDQVVSDHDAAAHEPHAAQPIAAAEPAATAERAALQALVAEQRALHESLTQAEATPELDAARQSTERALADLQAGDVQAALISQQQAAQALAGYANLLKHPRWAAWIGVLTILAIVLWQKFATRHMKVLPAALVAVLLATVVTALLDLPVLYVDVPGRIADAILLPSWSNLATLTDSHMLITAGVIAVVASAETLLCCSAVDRMHSGPRTKYDRELAAQGIGNMVCGLAGALPMTGVIVRSGANVQAGAQSRLSTMLHGVWILVFVAGLSFLLKMIPTASLAAMLVYTGYKLVNPKEIKSLAKFGSIKIVIYLATMITIVATDLLLGVMVGMLVSLARLLYVFSHLSIHVKSEPEQQRTTIDFQGSATFLQLPKLARVLESIPPGTHVTIHFEQLDYIDHACLDLLTNWDQQHRTTGGELTIDWDSLIRCFREVPAVRRASEGARGPKTVATALGSQQPAGV